jgi:hypothetical protein
MRSRFTIGLMFCAVLWPMAAGAQSDDVSLGDLARDARKNKAQLQQAHPVIDNENLEQAMQDASKLKGNDHFVLSIDPGGKGFKVSAPDVTCSLSFSARAASLLIKPVLVEDLPVSELVKLDGPASIEGDSLQLEVFNGTDWELREITVGLTLERRAGENAELAARARVIPAAEGLAPPSVEKRSDVTILYRLKGQAKPFSTTTFRESIGAMLAADQDWHWSIVEAKGVRSQDAPPQLPPDVLPQTPIIAPATPAMPELAPSSNAATSTPAKETNQ